ncbi:MAG: laminin B domain-containing protein [Phycisphaerales bacterium JB065]
MKTILTIAALGLVAGTTAFAGGSIESTFDADAEGWGTLNDARDFAWTDEFGNPGAAIRATDVGTGEYWFFSASEAYLGDRSAFMGGLLSWDIYGIVGNQNANTRADVMLVGGGLSIGVNVPVEPENGEWTSWAVVLDEAADWRLVNSLGSGSLTSTDVTNEQLLSVLAELEGVYIRGEYTAGGDSSAIDNVRLAPPPCGDVTGDGHVDLADLNLVLAMFGMDTDQGDANEDGTVNLADLNLVLAQFGGICGVPV